MAKEIIQIKDLKVYYPIRSGFGTELLIMFVPLMELISQLMKEKLTV